MHLHPVLLGRGPPIAGARANSSRSERLRSQADHDAGAVARLLGSTAVAGCFCQGELGPVGGRTFVHGFTASVALW
jgi:small ligand-binding sensory domain FIST